MAITVKNQLSVSSVNIYINCWITIKSFKSIKIVDDSFKTPNYKSPKETFESQGLRFVLSVQFSTKKSCFPGLSYLQIILTALCGNSSLSRNIQEIPCQKQLQPIKIKNITLLTKSSWAGDRTKLGNNTKTLIWPGCVAG
jgi:hypothetical protein